MTSPVVAVVNGRGARRARRGHPWIYRDDVVEVSGDEGTVARVVDRGGRFCCWASLSPTSRIVLRRLAIDPEPPSDEFWEARLARAVERRGAAARRPDGCARLVHSDADGFPGLTVDRYGAHLVAQATTGWADAVAPVALGLLGTLVGAESALARNDAAVRELEGLPRTTRQLFGTTPEEIEVEEAGVRRVVDPWRGHKTGLYLDQQENHRAAADWLPEGEILDIFAAEGGFAIPLAVAGRRVIAVEQSAALIERGRRAAALADVAGRVGWVSENAFDVLAAFERLKRTFDGIVLDPPPFARHRSESSGALRGYRDLHRRAFHLLRPGGRLATFSCSFAIGDADFEAVVREGCEEAEVEARVLARLGPSADHPELLQLPESRYLKGLLLERLDP